MGFGAIVPCYPWITTYVVPVDSYCTPRQSHIVSYVPCLTPFSVPVAYRRPLWLNIMSTQSRVHETPKP